MAATVSLTYSSILTAIETLDQSLVPDAVDANRKITHNGFNTASLSLSGSTTPPVSMVASFQQALSGGAATIDLTNMPGTNGAAVNGTGLKVRAFKFLNPATNANPITIATGASNGYALAGSAFSVTLAPGQETSMYLKDGAPAIGSGAKTLDLTGTGSQVLHAILVIG